MEGITRHYILRKKKGAQSSVYAIALVKNPAIEVGFVALSDDKVIPYKLSAEQRMLYTPMLIPGQKIQRKDEQGIYTIEFEPETVKAALHDLMKAKLTDKFNEEHIESMPLAGVNVVEGWIIEDPKTDKATTLGFKLPKGTAMLGIHVDNEESWAKVKSGDFQGISIEGYYDDYEANLSKTEFMEEQRTIKTMLSEAVAEIKSLLKGDTKLASVTAMDGTVIYFEGELTEGANVYADEAMEVALPDGTYEVDGASLVVSGGIAQSMGASSEEETEMTKELVKAQKELIAKNEELKKQNAELTKANQELTKEKEATAKAKEELSKELQSTKTELSKLRDEPAAKGAYKFNKSNPNESGVDALWSRFGQTN